MRVPGTPCTFPSCTASASLKVAPQRPRLKALLASDAQTLLVPVHRFGDPRPNLGTSHLSCSSSPGPILGGRASRAPTSSSSPTPTHPSPGQGPVFLASCTLLHSGCTRQARLPQHGPLYPILHRDSQNPAPDPSPSEEPDIALAGLHAKQAPPPSHPKSQIFLAKNT